MKFTYTKNISIALVASTILSGLMSSNTTHLSLINWVWITNLFFIYNILLFKRRLTNQTNKKDYAIVNIYFIWMIIGVIRGTFDAEGYWRWKNLISSSFDLSLPIIVYAFSSPALMQKALRTWLKVCIPLFFILFMWILDTYVYQLYLAPIFLLGIFIPVIKAKWKIIFLILLIMMTIQDLSARSQVLKCIITVLLSFLTVFSDHINVLILKLTHWILYIGAVLLLVLGLTGTFNIFEYLGENTGKYEQKVIENGEEQVADLATDTRSFLYKEVLASAIKNHYVLFGRTPARGNDSASFGVEFAEVLKTGLYERQKNEVCHPNIFTWLGLVGVLLYGAIYLKSSFLAIYRSNNFYMKVIGVLIAFHWAYGWVEDFNNFDILNFSLWMLIAMGFSNEFREMNNTQFKLWIQSIF